LATFGLRLFTRTILGDIDERTLADY
jgi:hypothetical protein